jgi:hypothetical protein
LQQRLLLDSQAIAIHVLGTIRTCCLHICVVDIPICNMLNANNKDVQKYVHRIYPSDKSTTSKLLGLGLF